MYSFIDIPTYELLTGTIVAEQDQERMQALLDLNSDLIGLYLREPCAQRVITEFPNVLAAMVAWRVQRTDTIPDGIQTESVGSSSVTYVVNAQGPKLTTTETSVLDMLCGRMSYGTGIGSVSFAGAFVGTDSREAMWERLALRFGWPTRWRGWNWAATDREAFFTDATGEG